MSVFGSQLQGAVCEWVSDIIIIVPTSNEKILRRLACRRAVVDDSI
jgi:hypothetical protein